MNNAIPETVDVEQLQRQLAATKAQAAHIERLLQAQNFNAGSVAQSNITLDHVVASQGDYHLVTAQLSSHYGFPDGHSINIPRSRSTMGHVAPQMASSMTEQGMAAPQAFKRQRRAFSQQSAPTQPMNRNMSNRSETNMPFVQQGPIRAIANPAMDRRGASQNEPALQSLSPASQRLPRVQEDSALMGVGMDPREFIARFNNTDDFASNSYRMNLAPDDACIAPFTSGCPSMGSCSSVTEATSPLTRQNSSFDTSSLMDADMVRMMSTQSCMTDGYPTQDSLFPGGNVINLNGKRPATDSDFFGMGGNLNLATSAPNTTSYLTSPGSVDMERSFSSASAASMRSNASNLVRRAKEARERVLQNSATVLAPKPQEVPNSLAMRSTPSKKAAKVPLNKTTYTRPKHPKVNCTQCDEHPEGFRGDHELRRHINAKHEGIVKKFVCRDPASVGIVSNVQAVNPLDKCKACVSGKQYGAYYNAAAHLRRTHFKPKTPRGKNKGNNEEKRGGKGGGDWPPMSDLKLWFEDILVQVDQTGALASEQEDNEAETVETSMNQAMLSGTSGSMPVFDVNNPYDMSLEGAADPASILAATQGMAIPTPISSASESFEYSPYSETSSLTSLPGDYTFSDPAMSVYSSNVSSTNTITPSTYNDMNNMAMADNTVFNLEL